MKVLDLAEGIRVVQSDAVQALRELEDGSVDLVVTDPAYRSLDKHRYGSRPRLVQWFPTVPNEYFHEFFRECYRCLRSGTHMYVMCDYETAFEIVPMAKAVGFDFGKPIIHDKLRMGMGYNYRASYEMILFFKKGKRRLRDLGVRDVIPVARVTGKQFYPTTKPDLVYRLLITQSSEYGELVVDPFAGSGTAAEAAHYLGRRFYGSDTEDLALRYCEARFNRT